MGAAASILRGSMSGVETRSAWGYVAWAPGMSDESGAESSDEPAQEAAQAIPVIPDSLWRPALGGA